RTAQLMPVLRAEVGHPGSAEYGPAPAASGPGNLQRFLPSYLKVATVSKCKRLRLTSFGWCRTTEHVITRDASNHNRSRTSAPDIFCYFISTLYGRTPAFLALRADPSRPFAHAQARKVRPTHRTST